MCRVHPQKQSNYYPLLSSFSTKSQESSSSSSTHNNVININRNGIIGLFAICAMGSFGAGHAYSDFKQQQQQKHHDHHQHHQHNKHVLPSGYPRSCCAEPADTEKKTQMINELEQIVGKDYVNSSSTSMEPFLKGARLGHGPAAAVVRPSSISQAIECLRVILKYDYAVIPQGANTGLVSTTYLMYLFFVLFFKSVPCFFPHIIISFLTLQTGGSVPRANAQPSVVLSMRRMDSIFSVSQQIECKLLEHHTIHYVFLYIIIF